MTIRGWSCCPATRLALPGAVRRLGQGRVLGCHRQRQPGDRGAVVQPRRRGGVRPRPAPAAALRRDLVTALVIPGIEQGTWQVRGRSDPAARALADQDYSRKTRRAPWIGPPGRVLVLVTSCERAVWLTHSKSSATSNSSTRSAQSSVESRASSVVLASSWCLTARNTPRRVSRRAARAEWRAPMGAEAAWICER